MSLLLPRLAVLRLESVALGSHRSIATVAHRHHPNPGNFANRPREELEEIGYRGGKKGGKAKGSGGFHSMDPVKQREISSAGGRATKKAAREFEEAATEFGHEGSAHACHTWKSHEPSVVPPALGEWKST
ncbi:hypothetical protein N7478_005622 [Penicillium angulare]|uniref:uncharacterized protein n=1 Tax=Penicillium angulare TaxID=116970 RepID=UPI00254040F6|nr:uncharacterized protein N7478_005622 [Penicillium angulare]KAJ5280250.1 hypothetical protein N7478_005622 [Penicillium angulare]